MAEVLKEENNQEESLSVLDIFYLCLNKWKWILASVIICIAIAFLYVKKTPPTYRRSASILIKEEKRGRSVGAVSDIADLGLVNQVSNVNNEMITLASPFVVSGVVDKLGLDVNYYIEGPFYKKLLYGSTLPFQIKFLDQQEEHLAGTLSVKDNQFTLNVIEDKEVVKVYKGAVLDTVKTDMGRLYVSYNPKYQPVGETFLNEVEIVKMNRTSVIDAYKNAIEVSLADKQASVIDINFVDVSIERADDILNTLIISYDENIKKERNEQAINTTKFIDERLKLIAGELRQVENDISSFKSQNLIPNVEQAAGLYFSKSDAAGDALFDYTNRLSMAKIVRQQLTNQLTKNQLVPSNIGLDEKNIEQLITDYNTELFERNTHAENISDNNPLIQQYDQRLSQMRKIIIVSLDNYINTLNRQIKSIQEKEAKSNSQLAANPSQAKHMLSVERQQKVKESLYLYLLQKREENEMSQSYTRSNVRITAPASGSPIPIAPAKNKIFLIAIAIGLALPIGLIYMLETMNTKVRGRKDIENLRLPYVGEIPQIDDKKKRSKHKYIPLLVNKIKEILRLDKGKKIEDIRKIVVCDGKRDYINEAFRVVRANLEYILKGDMKVIMTSSMNPGSGKTFLAMNLATSYAIKKKKVIAVDLDLRKGSLSTYLDSPKKGIANYLNEKEDDFHNLIIKDKVHNHLDVLPCGSLPPNPSELLYSERLAKMVNQLREEYDIVFLDCPPVEMLADATIINKLVDVTLFVVRADWMERSMLPIINDMYDNKKYKNMTLLLNGTSSAYGRTGYHKYGYGYGYGYGHYGNYGEGYYGNQVDGEK